MFGRKKIAMLVAEFLGTGFLTLVFLAVQRSTIGVPYFVALGAGLIVAALAVAVGNVSGAHFNPAITIGLWTTRKVKTFAAAAYIVVQLLGGWAAYGVYTYFVHSSLQPIGGHFTARIMIAEAVGMFIFAFLWAAIAAQRVVASWTGAAYALGVIVAAAASIGFINPAVALGARAWDIWGTMGWAYVAGPLIGAIVGFNLYQIFFTDQYDSVTARISGGSSTRSTASKSAKSRKK
ncbi:MAG TPA: aquaporin [Candidatus Saccharimonadales bacterium]